MRTFRQTRVHPWHNTTEPYFCTLIHTVKSLGRQLEVRGLIFRATLAVDFVQMLHPPGFD